MSSVQRKEEIHCQKDCDFDGQTDFAVGVWRKSEEDTLSEREICGLQLQPVSFCHLESTSVCIFATWALCGLRSVSEYIIFIFSVSICPRGFDSFYCAFVCLCGSLCIGICCHLDVALDVGVKVRKYSLDYLQDVIMLIGLYLGCVPKHSQNVYLHCWHCNVILLSCRLV